MPAELLKQLVFLLLPVAPHLGIEVAVEIGGRGAAAFLDSRDDGLLVRVSDVALNGGTAGGGGSAKQGVLAAGRPTVPAPRTSTSVSLRGTKGSKVPAKLTELMLDESCSALTPPDASK